MTPQNLKLPLCPKCGDTKFVEHDMTSTKTLSIQLAPHYKCTQCRIEWSLDEILDEFGVEHNLISFTSSGVMRSPNAYYGRKAILRALLPDGEKVLFEEKTDAK
jgi:hypothetical protein